MFIEKAKVGKNSFWLYLAGLVLVFISYFLGGVPLILAMTNARKANNADLKALEKADFTALGMDLNFALLLNLVPFALGLLALWFVVKYIHRRKFKSLFTTSSQLNYSKIGFAALLWLAFNLFIELATYQLSPANYTFSFELANFLWLCLICLLILPLQTSFEELLVRGYLLQGIGLRFAYRLIPLLLTALFFGILHIVNPEVSQFGLFTMMSYYVGFGIAAAIFTLMDDSTEIALGLHWANNFFGAVFVSFEGSALKTYALFHIDEINPQLMLALWFPSICLYGFIMAKKFGWKNWKTRLLGKGIAKISHASNPS